tara:strand:+ start:40590 stop:41795 length:1206 start_codon:yes stop_codon:yes gene_type:complete
MDKKQVAIIGAGLSGLVLADQLLKEKFEITVFEKNKEPGGRMRTSNIQGWELDHGFQVLLSAYPYLKKYGRLSDLELVKLDPGATIFNEKKKQTIGDPIRDLNFLFPTLFSTAGSIKDKFLIFKLRRYADSLSIDEIFALENSSTLAFLKSFGFSARFIDQFFKPFYSGIFLEGELRTSCRMFLFVFKMFSKGDAVIPKGGIGKLAKNMVRQMDEVDFKFNTAVERIEKNEVFANEKEYKFDLIINTNPSFNIDHRTDWKGSFTFYFEHQGKRIIEEPRIGLIPNEEKLINNIFYADHIQSSKRDEKSLLSVTVVNSNGLNGDDLLKHVTKEVEELVNQPIKYVHHFELPKSLPDVELPENSIDLDISESVIHIGDYVLNGSQNAACKIAGELSVALNERY